MYAGHILDLRKGTKRKGDIFGGLFSKIGHIYIYIYIYNIYINLMVN